MPYYLYILANKPNGTFYVGKTEGLVKRVWQHKKKHMDGFTAKYNLDKLAYYEILDEAAEMVQRERLLKFWKREWKISLIEKNNPMWVDLYPGIINR
jgi:putative endonuclease